MGTMIATASRDARGEGRGASAARPAASRSAALSPLDRLVATASAAGCPRDQLRNFLASGYVPQPKQLEFHAAARLCDRADGPDQVGFGGARGPGKSHGVFAQVALDDCRRWPGLKVLYLRKALKQAREQFDDLRRRVRPSSCPAGRRHAPPPRDVALWVRPVQVPGQGRDCAQPVRRWRCPPRQLAAGLRQLPLRW